MHFATMLFSENRRGYSGGHQTAKCYKNVGFFRVIKMGIVQNPRKMRIFAKMLFSKNRRGWSRDHQTEEFYKT